VKTKQDQWKEEELQDEEEWKEVMWNMSCGNKVY